MSTNEQVVRNFIEAWSRLDPAELAGFFHESGVYHNMPAKPVEGRESVQLFISGFISTWTETDWEILSLFGEGDWVMCERIDRTKTTQGEVDLPCCGVFQMESCQIKLWRDYFDMGPYLRVMAT